MSREANAKQNEKKYQEELREKYNPDNIFKNQAIETTSSVKEPIIKDTAIVEYKETIFVKIRNWFKSLFYKK